MTSILTNVLMNACSDKDFKAVDRLLKAGANVDAQDSYGQTALWYADNERREDDAAVTKLLLSYGACANVVDKWGANVLRYCKNAEKINLLSKLIK